MMDFGKFVMSFVAIFGTIGLGQINLIPHVTRPPEIGGFATEIILANDSDEAVSYQIMAYDKAGRVLAEIVDYLDGAQTIFETVPAFFSSDPQYANGAWRVMAPMPTVRQEMPHAIVDGKIYLPGGLDVSTDVDIVEVYDPATDSWTSVAPLPDRRNHVGAVGLNGELYVMGGYRGQFAVQDNFWKYDPETETWTEKAPLLSPRGAPMAVAYEDQIYVVGGRRGDQTPLSTFEAYDPQTDTWSSLPPMPTPRDHASAVVIGTKLYVTAGRPGRLQSHEAYDFETGQWEILSDLPTGRSGVVGAALHGRLYVMGGEIPGLFEENEEYDPLTDTWRTVEPMRTPRHGMGAAAIGDSIYVIAGGSLEGWGPTNVNEVFSIGGEISHLVVVHDLGVTLSAAYQGVHQSGESSPAHVHESSVQAQRWRFYAGNPEVTWDGLAIVNTGDSMTDVEISQFDSNGNLIQSQLPDNLVGLGPLAKGLIVISGFDPRDESYFEISAGQPLAVMALRGSLDSSFLWENAALPIQ